MDEVKNYPPYLDHPKPYKPQTNADLIRAMSDEELANWLARTQMGAIKDAMAILQFPCDATDEIVELGTRESLLWLKQPADMRGEEE